jgi:DNA-binding LytR/AlgR family response regulator
MMKSFFIRADNKFIRIRYSEIVYIEALKNYIRIVTEKDTYLALITMKKIESELPEACFCRVHRSFIVSLEHIVFFSAESVTVGNKALPIGSIFKTALLEKINIVQQQHAT